MRIVRPGARTDVTKRPSNAEIRVMGKVTEELLVTYFGSKGDAMLAAAMAAGNMASAAGVPVPLLVELINNATQDLDDGETN